MKKLLGIVVLGLLWCNISFAECIEGDCNNGYGTYTWTDGAKYVGEFKEGSMHGRGTYITTDGSTYTGEFKDGKLVELKEQPKKKSMKMKMTMDAMRMEIAPTGFDFICYNSCKDFNDEAFLQTKMFDTIKT